MRYFEELQARLTPVETGSEPTASTDERVIVSVPSLNFDASVLEAHRQEMPALEERSLWIAFVLRRPRVQVVAVTALPVEPAGVDHLLSLIPDAPDARERLHLLAVGDDSARPLSRKLLDRPDLLERIRGIVAGRPGSFVFPFNVRSDERELALALDLPIYGVDDRFLRYGTKSGARDLFRRRGVAMPDGAEDLHDLGELHTQILRLRAANPTLGGVVAKLDDRVYGEGNQIIALRDLPPPGTPEESAALDVRLRGLPAQWRDELALGGIVEEMVEAEEIRSPSVQLRVLPGGHPVVVSTHDQVLGGPLGQTFLGCRFPADAAYSGQIVEEARKVGKGLAAEGVVGRFGVDFVVARKADGSWSTAAVEINLREGGTSHPYASLWMLSDGKLSRDGGEYWTARSNARFYFATDHLEAPHYCGLEPERLDAEARRHGLLYDPATQTGVVLHMLRDLRPHGRCAAVAIGASPADANERYLALVALLDRLAAG